METWGQKSDRDSESGLLWLCRASRDLSGRHGDIRCNTVGPVVFLYRVLRERSVRRVCVDRLARRWACRQSCFYVWKQPVGGR